jgi:hypothetical protein
VEQIARIFPAAVANVDGIDIGSLFDVCILIVIALKRAILFRIRNVLRMYRLSSFVCSVRRITAADLTDCFGQVFLVAGHRAFVSAHCL